MEHFILQADFLSRGANFLFKGNKNNKTIFGAILGMVCMLAIVAAIIYFGINLIYRQSLSIISNTYYSKYSNYTINTSDYFLVLYFGVGGSVLDNPLQYLQVSFDASTVDTVYNEQVERMRSLQIIVIIICLYVKIHHLLRNISN
jgi:glycerol-3-phosphate acyltransferase PlsY